MHDIHSYSQLYSLSNYNDLAVLWELHRAMILQVQVEYLH